MKLGEIPMSKKTEESAAAVITWTTDNVRFDLLAGELTEGQCAKLLADVATAMCDSDYAPVGDPNFLLNRAGHECYFLER